MSDDEAPAGRRRHLDRVGEELAALRRDVADHGAALSEALPRLDDLTTGVADLRALVGALHEDHEARERMEKAEREARRAAGLLDDPPSPWAWPVLDRGTAEKAWDSIGRWTTAVLVDQHQLTLGQLPSCWPAHRGAVAELTALRSAHVAAHQRGAHPGAALTWARELPPALARIYSESGAIRPNRCPPGIHHVDPAHLPAERERERVAAIPCAPQHWQQLLSRVVADDLAARRQAPGP